MKNYLFTLTIASVQDFIKQSQKTKDLFNSSEIVVRLMKKAIEEFKNKYGEIIIPANTDIVSNKFVGILENKNGQEVKEIGKDLENKINNEFINFIFNKTCTYKDNLKNFFQIYWVAVELDENNYKSSYKKLERSLGAIKNIRKFTQDEQEEGKSKCILCGERNQIDTELCLVCYAKRKCILCGERNQKGDDTKLCLVCLAKRECKFENRDYPSTAKIALLDWLENVDYKELKKDDFDEQLFYEYESKNDEIKNKIENFIKKNHLDTSKQKKYYALIQFDIDSLGKKLSSLNKDEQKELSKFLTDFAKESKKIVDNRGKTIYAGGDDFLGFVNLAYLFDVIEKIRKAFNRDDLTFSTSIVIAHYKAPLHKVLDYSRNLLKEAKDFFDDKNGVGLMVMSSNAIISKTICRYEDLDLLKKMKDKDIAKSLHFKLSNIFDYLENMSFDEFLIQKEMIKIEIKRLLKREQTEFNENIYQKLMQFFNKQSTEISTNNYSIDFDNFIGFLKTLEQIRKVSK